MTEEIIIDKEDKTKKHRNNEIDCLHFGCRKGENGNVLFWCDFYDDHCDNYSGCYYRKYLRLEQENKELKSNVLKWQKAFSRQYQINENKGYSKAEENYRSALEEIKNNFMCFRSCMIPFHIGNKENLPHNMADAIQNYCESIINKINEVLGND